MNNGTVGKDETYWELIQFAAQHLQFSGGYTQKGTYAFARAWQRSGVPIEEVHADVIKQVNKLREKD